jgi:hypothetical protein
MEKILTILKLNIRFINNKTNKDEHDNKEMQESITPLMALEILKGNSRFINNLIVIYYNKQMIQLKDNIHLQLLSWHTKRTKT